MAQLTDPNQSKAQPIDRIGEELNPEQLENLILSEAPDFAEDLKQMKSLHVDSSVDLDVVDDGQIFSPDNPWRNASGIRKIMVTILPFLPKFWDLKQRFLMNWHLHWARLSILFSQAGPRLLQATKTGALATVESSKVQISNFKKLTRSLKIVVVCLILVGALTLAFIYLSITKGVLPEEKEYLTASLEEWSAQSYQTDADTEMESFYDSTQTIQNIMSLPKMIVNLQPSSLSGPNPMAAVEFFLEGLSPEAIVEVKDRETEIRDLFQRTIEEMTYTEMESVEGKQLLTEKLRQILNVHLTKGKIRRVFFKEAVVKP
ncbi:MAG TPA: flagellar basal body-associated FliL family protein [Pseudobdellovibrionaceae bacterium]|jgi:flagellar basal body-associated protein FliL